jgi:transposase-like protein
MGYFVSMGKLGAKSHPMWYDREEKKTLMENALELIAEGNTIESSALTVGVKPSTLRDWMREDEWAAASARARELGTHAMADECIKIADQREHDIIKTQDGEKPNLDHIARAKLRIDTRLRLIGQWNRRDYGQKVTNEHTGDGGGPIKQIHELDLSNLDQAVIINLMQVGAITDEN